VVTLRHFPEEEILHAIALSEKEMLKNGIIAVGDICNNPSTISCKKNSKIDFYNLIETSGWLPQIAGKRFHLSKINYDEFLKNNLIASIVPHAPYSVSDELWKK
jgi:hypothetical protein